MKAGLTTDFLIHKVIYCKNRQNGLSMFVNKSSTILNNGSPNSKILNPIKISCKILM